MTHGIVRCKRVVGGASTPVVEVVKLAVVLDAHIADVLIILEAGVVVRLARFAAAASSAYAGVDNHVVWTANLMVTFVVLAASIDEKVAAIIVIRAAIVVVEGPDAIVPINDEVFRDCVWYRYNAGAPIVAACNVRGAVPVISRKII